MCLALIDVLSDALDPHVRVEVLVVDASFGLGFWAICGAGLGWIVGANIAAQASG
jgi:hypothetical protein